MKQAEILAVEWLRALRGKRSQRGFSQRLGYRSNIAYRWESGGCYPTARTTLGIMKTLRHDVRAAVTRFYGSAPAWLSTVDPTSREGIATMLDDLRGRTPIVDLAERSGFSRHRVARWLSGATEPRLHEWLALVEASSLRLLDFVAAFFEPRLLPSMANDYRRLKAVREAAYSRPLSHVVLRALELSAYRALPTHDLGFLAQCLDMPERDVAEAIELLHAAGQVRPQGQHWVPVDEAVIDMRADKALSKKLKSFWLEQAAVRALTDTEGMFGYNLFSVSEKDLERLRALHLRNYREMQEIIAQSQPNERVVLFAAQLFCLDSNARAGTRA
jgi:DNA-binding phage protein